MNSADPLPLALTMGDPAGCGPLITAAAWQALRGNDAPGFYVIGAAELYSPHVPVQFIEQQSDTAEIFPNALPVLPVQGFMPVQPGQPNPESAASIIASITLAVEHIKQGLASGIVTNPINKALLYKAGFAHPGHTELLAKLCETPETAPLMPVMMLVGGGLHVALATIHMPLKDVADALSIEHLTKTARITHHDLVTRFGLQNPRLAFTGLNPHAGEGGALGREEIEIINPAAKALREDGIDICDARPADTVFAEALSGQYDAVIAMTHDQGLIPVKTLDFWGGVNVTLGLPIIRTSPDHGTAYDAAAAGNARADSLIAAIKLALQMTEQSIGA